MTGYGTGCEHCWHSRRGPIFMVIPDGHLVQECCQCHGLRTVHAYHWAKQAGQDHQPRAESEQWL